MHLLKIMHLTAVYEMTRAIFRIQIYYGHVCLMKMLCTCTKVLFKVSTSTKGYDPLLFQLYTRKDRNDDCFAECPSA